jgi:hypothetical protein
MTHLHCGGEFVLGPAELAPFLKHQTGPEGLDGPVFKNGGVPEPLAEMPFRRTEVVEDGAGAQVEPLLDVRGPADDDLQLLTEGNVGEDGANLSMAEPAAEEGTPPVPL